MASDFDEENLRVACLRMSLCPVFGCGGSEAGTKGASECVGQLTCFFRNFGVKF